MMNSTDFGKLGEDIAERYLKKRGWHILARNFRCGSGEIDILGYRLGILVCFEVKTRSDDSFGSPASAVNEEKLRKISSALRVLKTAYSPDGKLPVRYFSLFTVRRRIFKERTDIIEVFLTRKRELKGINHIKQKSDKGNW